MKKPVVLIIGGGFAGISAAVHLTEAGTPSLLCERKRFLGGRAFSFIDPKTQETIDNGQHLLMSCYHHTLELLSKIGTRHQLWEQKKLQIDFIDAQRKRYQLTCPAWNSPLSLLIGLLRFNAVSFTDRCRALIGLLSISFKIKEPQLTVKDWLTQLKQPLSLQNAFWTPLCLAVLNDPPAKASAVMLQNVLAFLKGAPTLIIPTTGLSELTGQAAENYLSQKGNVVQRHSAVTHLHIQKNRITSASLLSGETLPIQAVIAAIPPPALKKIAPLSLNLKELPSSPILSIQIWFCQKLFDAPFLAFLDSPLHWIFNNQALCRKPFKAPYLYSIVISAAEEWIALSSDEIKKRLIHELSRFFSHVPEIDQIKIIKEKEATLSSAPNLLSYRLSAKTNIENLFLAGDWTQTGLPATIESAVLSGKLASEAFLKWENKTC